MKICVLIKQVPDQESVLKINSEETWVVEDNLVFTTNESDTYALEEALLLKESVGGEVVVCTLGPERSSQALKDALAKGADRALFMQDEIFDQLDSQGTARVIAQALREEQFDLILTGLQADDTGDAQLGPMLAEELDRPHVTLVVETELLNGGLKVKQELEGGWFQHIEIDLPALLTIQSGINKPRYASLRGIMAMKSKEIKQITAQDMGLDTSSLIPYHVVKRLYVPPKTKETTFLEGTPDEVVEQLVQRLTNEAKVL
ncbi:MAG: electron transfer flavoprotein subunit beta/FixA family protein [Fidelibacterota bacterium]|nr:MAG: electron transfer flavoprotein subunit beta/FixA family protein [Candidatus Neomarinimicrobiota bacterium]